ncbi:MAG: hypothetical protein HC895_14920 [Leptolyngbyaceae cyanobacterium SM1_3_5]|nr:hypothetical protein [Leptolyngbyaceae cyanobacterium SM1_3_5]
MMSATGKRPKTSIVSQKLVEQAGAFLAELPEKPKEKLSLREAITQIQDQIKAALAKGYSYEDIAKILGDRGIDISASTLKTMCPQADAKRPKSARRPKSTPRSLEARRKGEAVARQPCAHAMRLLADCFAPTRSAAHSARPRRDLRLIST